MRLKRRYLLTGLLILGFTAAGQPAAGEDRDVEISANRESLYLEESLVLSIKVPNADSRMEPDVSAIRDCDVKFLGSHAQNYSSTTWINGKMTRTGFKGRLYSYNITPRRTGRIPLGPIVIGNGDNAKTVMGPTVTVTGIEEQDDVVLKVTASRNTVLVDESFEVTLDIYIKSLDSPHEETERLLSSRPPHLSVPFLTLAPMDGLEHTDVRTLLQNMIVRRESKPSFTLNNYASRRDPFDFDSMFNFNEARRSTPDRFSFPVTKISRGGKPYWHYQVQTKYVAREERTHTFGPVIFKGGIIESIDTANQVALKQVFAVGPSQTVRVVPPPEEGRPSSFVGAIGTNMTVDASLDAQNCRVGDPLTLTLSISGGVNLKNIYPPNLSAQTPLLKQFRLYDDTLSINRTPDRVSFSYTIRPTEAGTLEVPGISLAYFDSASRKYRTVKTSPIPVTAADADDIDTGMILGVDTNRQQALYHDQASLRYIAPFVTHPSASRPAPFGPGLLHVLIIVLSPAILIAVIAVKPARQVRNRLDDRSEQRNVYRNTVKKLKKASSLPDSEASASIVSSILAYAAHRFKRNARALTPPDVSKLLAETALNAESRRELSRIVSDHFNASFDQRSEKSLDIAADAKRAASIISELDKLQRSAGSTLLPLLIGIALLTVAAPALAAGGDESEFLWQKAWSRTLSAATPEEYAKVANDYRELAAAGIRNKHVFYNMGTALLMAGDKESALRAFERAERYGGTDSRTIYNIGLAGSGHTEEPRSTSWARIVLFWHYALPTSLRLNISVASWALLFALLAFGVKNRGYGFRSLIGIVLAILVIFGSSALTSLFQEHRDRIRDTYIAQHSPAKEDKE